MSGYVENQIQRILDEGHGRTRHVIIQMQNLRQDLDTLLETAAEAVRRQTMAVSARSLLPTQARYFRKDDSLTEATRRRHLRGAGQSLSAQVRARGIESMTPQAYTDNARAALRPLISRTESKVKQSCLFWAASSASMEMGKDDLWALRNLQGVENIFENRELKIPPVIEAEEEVKPQISSLASSWGIEAIGGLAAWGAWDARGQDVTVAVLDTGVDPEHPDLAGKLDLWAEFDRNGAKVENSTPHDSDRHGTHCAGTVVGGNSSGSWIGVAPRARLAAGLVLKGGSGTDAQILAGMQWAIDNRVDIMSLSLGGLSFDAQVHDTYTRAILTANRFGIPVVVAIGNSGQQTSGAPGNDLFAISVGATAPGDRAAGFSGGRTQVIRESRWIRKENLPLVYSKPDLSAPGVAVRSSIPGGGFESFNGTSMATPHVAGALALLLSGTDIKNQISPEDRVWLLRDLLTGSVDDLGEAGQDHRFGFGRLNILRAIGEAKSLGF